MWDPCSGERFPRSQSRFLPGVLEGLGRKRDPRRAQGGKANEYRLAVMNERHKGGIEGQLKKKKHSHGGQSEHYVHIFRLLPAVIYDGHTL